MISLHSYVKVLSSNPHILAMEEEERVRVRREALEDDVLSEDSGFGQLVLTNRCNRKTR